MDMIFFVLFYLVVSSYREECSPLLFLKKSPKGQSSSPPCASLHIRKARELHYIAICLKYCTALEITVWPHTLLKKHCFWDPLPLEFWLIFLGVAMKLNWCTLCHIVNLCLPLCFSGRGICDVMVVLICWAQVNWTLTWTFGEMTRSPSHLTLCWRRGRTLWRLSVS